MVGYNKNLWEILILKINEHSIGDKFLIITNPNFAYGGRYILPECHYLILLRKLGFIDKIEISVYGEYVKLKQIPTDLSLKNAKFLSKGIKLEKPRKRLKKSTWCSVIDTINNINIDIFDALELFGTIKKYNRRGTYIKPNVGKLELHTTYKQYLSILTELQYIEKISKDKTGKYLYKNLKKIPDELTTNVANSMCFDKSWKRKRKILKLKKRYGGT